VAARVFPGTPPTRRPSPKAVPREGKSSTASAQNSDTEHNAELHHLRAVPYVGHPVVSREYSAYG
jgi:hypothetical protein